MKRVALITCYFQHNYGSMLQAYATQRYLDKINIPNETIRVDGFANEINKAKIKYFTNHILHPDIIKDKWGSAKLLLQKKIMRKTLGKNIKTRDKSFDSFYRKHIRLSKKFRSKSEVGQKAADYSAFLVGSDQLWLPSNIAADYYTLNFVPGNVKKIAYATSFGVSELPRNQAVAAQDFLRRFDFLSTREQSGKKIVNKLIGKDIPIVCDPTLLLNADEWMDIQKSERFISDSYIFCYLLGDNPLPRAFVKKLKKETGLKIVALQQLDSYINEDEGFADETPYDVDPGDFLNLIRNADYVCTDSLHGTIFSIINRKKFFSFRRFKKKTTMSTNSRLDSLLNQLDLSSRMIENKTAAREAFKKEIDYRAVYGKLSEFQRFSQEYLNRCFQDSIASKVDEKKKEDCCGCTACVNICPKSCIKMQSDEEGFKYPHIDINICVSCGLCLKICPVNKYPESAFEQRAFLIQHKDERILKESTSGAAFTAIAENVINRGGVVFGAAFDDNLRVMHTYVESCNELYRFRNSKYVQSNLKQSFNNVKEFLELGRWVCFSGTPCQVEGLKSFLGRDYCNLLTVDIVCHAIPSPLLWEKYKEYRMRDGSLITDAAFRDKSLFGYNYSQMAIKSSNGKKYFGVESDPYLKAFFADLSDRPICYACPFKKRYRVCDITLWDCFDVQKFSKKLNNNKGVTRALVHTGKGIEIIQSIKNTCTVLEIPVDDAVEGVREMIKSVPGNPKRSRFFSDLNKMTPEKLFKIYFPVTHRVRAERAIRILSAKLGVYAVTKRLTKKIFGKNQ